MKRVVEYEKNSFFLVLLKESKFVQAVRDYITNEDTSLLSFRKGDVIKLLNKSYTPHGWLRGFLNGRKGVFPIEYVRPVARVELCNYNKV
jgi:myosin XV